MGSSQAALGHSRVVVEAVGQRQVVSLREEELRLLALAVVHGLLGDGGS